MILPEIERRLAEWAKEYGHGDRGNGWQDRNLLATLIAHKGFVPDQRGYVPVATRTAADEVEKAVTTMARVGWIKPARVVRTEYFLAHLREEDRLREMAAIGLPVRRAQYHVYLDQAKAYITAAILHASKKTA